MRRAIVITLLLGAVAASAAGAARKEPPPGIHLIDHVVVIMQENRSFDQYFATYPGADGINPSSPPCVPDPLTSERVCAYADHNDKNYGGPHGILAGGSMDLRFFHRLGATLLDRSPLCGGIRSEAWAGTYGAAAPGIPPEQADHAFAAIELVLQLAVGDRDAEVAEVIRAARLDLIPGQDQAFPTGVNVGHHGRVTESFGNSQTRIEARRSGRRGAGQCQ